MVIIHVVLTIISIACSFLSINELCYLQRKEIISQNQQVFDVLLEIILFSSKLERYLNKNWIYSNVF